MGKIRKWLGISKIPPRPVVFYTRDNCHLCLDALAVLKKYARSYSLQIEVVDIGGDGEMEAEYGDQIPVVFIDGKKRFFGQVDEKLLLRLLNHPPK